MSSTNASSEEEEERDQMSDEITTDEEFSEDVSRKTKKKKPGIVYLSSIPPGFNVSRTTAFFADFGQVGRVFLQPDLKDKSKYRSFTEGWIEFTSKRTAREVADNLNCSQVGGKKRSKSHDVLWNIKYLPRFKWAHLTERLNYEKAVHHQKMRSEIAQAKREADFFKSSLDKSKRMKKSDEVPSRTYEFRMKETEESIRSKRKRGSSLTSETPTPSKKTKRDSSPPKRGKKNKGKGKSSINRSDFLKNVFSGAAE